MRIVIADLASRGGAIETFVANVDGNTSRLLAQMSVQSKDYFLGSYDCSDAYYMGTPYPMSDLRGRILLGRIPEGWEEFGYPRFNERGEKLYARLLKIMPGRREARKASATTTARRCSRVVSRRGLGTGGSSTSSHLGRFPGA